MPNVRVLRANFTAGEISPRLEDRYGLDKHRNACRTLYNCGITPHGTVYARSGTRFIAEPSFESSFYRFVQFAFSTQDTYQLLFGNLNFEVYRSAGRIEEAGVPVTVAHPWTEQELLDLVWAQSSDDIYITHEDKPPKVITRTSNTEWTVSDWEFAQSNNGNRIYQPHYKFADASVTLSASDTTGSVTVTASADHWTEDHVGTRIRKNDKELEITAYTSATQVTASVKQTLTGTGATEDWTEQAWSAVRGWPRVVAIHQSRLFVGGSRDLPNSYWFSQTQDLLNFDEGTSEDDEAISGDIGAGLAVDAITWARSHRGRLFVGTLEQPWTIGSGLSTDTTLTPGQNQADTVEGPGGPLQNVSIMNGSVAYIDTTRRQLIGLDYQTNPDGTEGFGASDLTLLAEHITASDVSGASTGLLQFAWQKDKENVGWGARADGALLGFTYMPKQDVAGWHRHEIGGNGFVQSVGALKTPTRYEVWLVVRREIEGQDRFFVEKMQPKFDRDTEQESAFFVDSGLTYSGGPVTTLFGLDHLDGLEVYAFGDGGDIGTFTVSDGAITLPYAVSSATVGLWYDSYFEPTQDDLGSPRGSTQGVKKRLIEFDADVIRTNAIGYGETFENQFVLRFVGFPVVLDGVPDLVTTSKTKKFQTGWRDDLHLVISRVGALPMEVRSLSMFEAING